MSRSSIDEGIHDCPYQLRRFSIILNEAEGIV
jgi:hypothetical protein